MTISILIYCIESLFMGNFTLLNKDEKLCFVLMPFHTGMKQVYTDAIKPACEKANFKPLRADELIGPYNIHDPVFDKAQRSFWTADKESAGRAWVVEFGYGYCRCVPDAISHYSVRAVR
jgi:hypothetical protein